MRARISVFLAGMFGAVAAAGGAWAQQDAGPDQPVVVELFSSQACSSCVAAAELTSQLALREDIVVLSWHVDYWNHLQTRQGRWVDPYSDPASTDRQRTYNKNIRQRSTVYTPQIIVNGATQTIGSARDDVHRLITDARQTGSTAGVAAGNMKDQVYFDISGAPLASEAYLVTFKSKVKTEIASGENAGVAYEDANVVTAMRFLGVVSEGGSARFAAEAPDAGERCAVIVQAPGQGRIAAAAYCAGG